MAKKKRKKSKEEIVLAVVDQVQPPPTQAVASFASAPQLMVEAAESVDHVSRYKAYSREVDRKVREAKKKELAEALEAARSDPTGQLMLAYQLAEELLRESRSQQRS